MSCSCQFDDSSHLATSCGLAANVTFIMSLVDLMIRTDCKISDPCRRASRSIDSSKKDENEFDFIVVGAGVAGSVVASRLSEKQNWKVLLIEAGPEEPTTTSVPAFAYSALGTRLDWNFKTEPQKTACQASDGVCTWPRGKMVAGTGAMTGMMYSRGHRLIFDNYAKEGNIGWSYEEVLPYFKKAETNLNPNIIEPEFHGQSGPMIVQRFPDRPALAEDVLKAGKVLGYEETDLNGKNQTGFAIAQMMVKDGLRASTARMYLRPAMNRKNLVVKINSHASKVIIDPWSKRTTGVEYIDEDGNVKIMTAKKEVIVSCGAVGSPHLLLLSGIGPKNDLKKHGIPSIQDLKVGHNLHNHVSAGIDFHINDANKTMLTIDAVRQFVKYRNGPLASTGLTQITAFIQSAFAEDGIPDLQLFFDGYSASCSSSGRSGECADGSFRKNCGRRMIVARPTNIMTKSRGYLTLRSNDPKAPPLIYANYLSDRRDVDVIIDGIKAVIRLSKTDPLQKWGFQLDKTPAAGCEDIRFGSDQYWECLIRKHTNPENHPAGSCKMGPVGDPNAVVDPELRVHGVTNLRVIDASVFPLIPNANPVSGIIMAAEKGSDMIKGAWSLQND